MTKMLWLLQACLANYIHNNQGLYVTEDLTYSPSNPPESFSYKFINLAENELKGQVPGGALVTADLEALQINPETQSVEKMKLKVRDDHRNKNLDVEQIKSLKVSEQIERKIKFYKIDGPKADIVRFVHTLNGKGEPKKCLIWGSKRLAMGDCNDARSYLRFQNENGLSTEEIKKIKNTATKSEDSSDLSNQAKDSSSDEALKNKENKTPKIQPATANTMTERQQMNGVIDEFKKNLEDAFKSYITENLNSGQSALAQNAQAPTSPNISSYGTVPQRNLVAANQQVGNNQQSFPTNPNILSNANILKTQQSLLNPNSLNNANPNILKTQQSPLNSLNTNSLNNANIINNLQNSLNHPNNLQNPLNQSNLNNANILNTLRNSLNLNNANPNIHNIPQNPFNQNISNNANSLLMSLLLADALKDGNENILSAELIRHLLGNNNSEIGINQLLAFNLLRGGQKRKREEDTSHSHEDLSTIARKVSDLDFYNKIRDSINFAKHESNAYTDKRLADQKTKSKTNNKKAKKPKTSPFSSFGPLGKVMELTPQGQAFNAATNIAGDITADA